MDLMQVVSAAFAEERENGRREGYARHEAERASWRDERDARQREWNELHDKYCTLLSSWRVLLDCADNETLRRYHERAERARSHGTPRCYAGLGIDQPGQQRVPEDAVAGDPAVDRAGAEVRVLSVDTYAMLRVLMRLWENVLPMEDFPIDVDG